MCDTSQRGIYIPHILQATTTEQHETGESLKKDPPMIRLHTAHATSYRTLHKLPRQSTNYCTRHKLPCLGSMRRGGEARKNIMIIQQQSNIAITTIIQYTKHPYHAFTPLPSTLTQASSSYRARVFRGVYVCFSSPIFRCIRSHPAGLLLAAFKTLSL